MLSPDRLSRVSGCQGPVRRAGFIKRLLYAKHGAQSPVCAISFNPLSDPVQWWLVIALFLKGANGGPELFKVTQQKQGLNAEMGLNHSWDPSDHQ